MMGREFRNFTRKVPINASRLIGNSAFHLTANESILIYTALFIHFSYMGLKNCNTRGSGKSGDGCRLMGFTVYWPLIAFITIMFSMLVVSFLRERINPLSLYIFNRRMRIAFLVN